MMMRDEPAPGPIAVLGADDNNLPVIVGCEDDEEEEEAESLQVQGNVFAVEILAQDVMKLLYYLCGQPDLHVQRCVVFDTSIIVTVSEPNLRFAGGIERMKKESLVDYLDLISNDNYLYQHVGERMDYLKGADNIPVRISTESFVPNTPFGETDFRSTTTLAAALARHIEEPISPVSVLLLVVFCC